MKAALFEVDSWAGHEVYIIEGDTASDILVKFAQLQELDSLISFGRDLGSRTDQKPLDVLEKLLDKCYSGRLTMRELKYLHVNVSAGEVKCSGIAETDEEVDKLYDDNPDAR